MTSSIKTQHPNGTKFEYVPACKIEKMMFMGLPVYRTTNIQPAGVRIIYPDGVRIFRPNYYYEHIEPLKPTDKEKMDGFMDTRAMKTIKDENGLPKGFVPFLITDKDRLDWIQQMMTNNSDYCEIFFAGLRNFNEDKASAFQIESNPQKFETVNAITLREAIDKAMNVVGLKPVHI